MGHYEVCLLQTSAQLLICSHKSGHKNPQACTVEKMKGFCMQTFGEMLRKVSLVVMKSQ